MFLKIAKQSDVPNLVILDRYSEFPKDKDWWTKVTGPSSLTMAELIEDNDGNVICYCLHQGHYVDHRFHAERVVELLVHPEHRRKKIGTFVMEALRSRIGPEHKLQTVLPEYTVYERPEIVGFFTSLGMEATGLVPECFNAFGQNYDGIIFEGDAKAPEGLLL